MDKFEFKKALQNSCEDRFARGNANKWKHSDFEDLSHEILIETKITISPNTLKRFFNRLPVPVDYFPQQATINALKKYSGFRGDLSADSLKKPVNKARITEFLKVRPVFRWLFIVSGIAFVIYIACVIVLQLRPAKGHITIFKQEGQWPATVFFKTDIPSHSDSVFVSWGDFTLPQYIVPKTQTVQHMYKFPGVFYVKLKTRERYLDHTTVAVYTHKWTALGFYFENYLRKRYFDLNSKKNGPDSVFHITAKELYSNGLDTLKPIISQLCNYAPTGYKADKFELDATLKNTGKWQAVISNNIQIHIAGSNGYIRIKFDSPGCSYLVNNQISDRSYRGNRSDLSAFARDLTKWFSIKMIDQNKQVKLYVDNKLIFSDSYTKPLGEILGVFIQFEGLGYAKSFRLATPSGRVLFSY